MEPQPRRRSARAATRHHRGGSCRTSATLLEGGFTLIEVLIASALLMVVTLGLLPLYVRSIGDNAAGAESTRLTNFARSRIEEYSQLDFNSPELTIDTGSAKVVSDYYSHYYREWRDGTPPAADPPAFVRTVTVRQYNATALQDLRLDPAEALPNGTGNSFVHLKEVVVVIQGTRQLALLGPAQRITLRIVKSQ